MGQNLEKLCKTPLQAAAYKGDIERLRELILAGADLNAVSGFFGTALQAACYRGQLHASKMLLSFGANANSSSNFHGNPIHTAARDGNAELIELLCEYGADVDAKGGVYGNALIAAAKGGHQAAVKILSIQGVKLNAEGRSEEYPTALYAASLHGHWEVVAWLLHWGAKPNKEYADGKSALRAAVIGAHEEIVALLMEYGALLAQECHKSIGELTMHMAAEGGHTELMWCLLTYPHIDADSPNEEGLSPLLIATSHGHTETVRVLLDCSRKSIDTTARDRNGSTALIIAASHGYLEVVRVILEHCARKGETQIYGQGLCSLMIAVRGGNQGLVLLHLELGVKPWDTVNEWHPYREGVTKRPLIAAIETGHEAITFLLLQHGAKIDDPDWLGKKPMDLAVSKGYRTIEKLLSFGDGKTAIADRDRWWKSVSRVNDEWN